MHLVIGFEQVCANCGESSQQISALSRKLSGSSTLDLRPSTGRDHAPADEYTQHCETCGYCAPEISRRPTAAESALVKTLAYQSALTDERWPPVVRYLTAQAMIQQSRGSHAKTALSLTAAAWALDDVLSEVARVTAVAEPGMAFSRRQQVRDWEEQAAVLRLQAAEELLKAEAHAGLVDGAQLYGRIMRVDLLRRCGQFERALQAIDAAEHSDNTGFGVKPWPEVLLLQRHLCRTGQTREASIDDAVAHQAAARQALEAFDPVVMSAVDDALQAGAERETPRQLLPRLRHVFMNTQTGQPRDLDMASLSLDTLPMPAALSGALREQMENEGWLGGEVLAAVGLAMAQMHPELRGGDEELCQLLARRMAHRAPLVKRLQAALQGSTPDAWCRALAVPRRAPRRAFDALDTLV
ncbi:MAG: hypothetical protein JNJ71_10920 [Rubrivivax sp.]|nr:hypothetical protein [Rubrivivax sp.]